MRQGDRVTMTVSFKLTVDVLLVNEHSWRDAL